MLGNIGPYVRITEEVAPDVVAELHGMAEGSAVPFETLFVLNAAAELMQSVGRFACTVVGISGAGTRDGHVLLAHNEDATAGWADLTYVITATPDGGPAFAAFTYAGLLLHQGVNAAGLGSVGNALYARDARPGIPKLLQYRRALTACTIEEAIRVVTDPRRAFGNNHLFATADGDLYDVEVSGTRWAMQPGRNGSLAHANHFTLPGMTDLDGEDDLLNSRLRQTRVETLVERRWGAWDACRLQGADGRSCQLSAFCLQAPRAGERARLRHDRQRRHRCQRAGALGLCRQPLPGRMARGAAVIADREKSLTVRTCHWYADRRWRRGVVA